MGKAGYIYFKDEINEKLKSEENKSALINKLLGEYYGTADGKKKAEITEMIDKLNNQKAVWEEKMIFLTEEEKEEARKEAEEERQKRADKEKWLNSAERWAGLEPIMRKAFQAYSQSEEMFKEFFKMLKEGKIKNLIQFAEMKGLKTKNDDANQKRDTEVQKEPEIS